MYLIDTNIFLEILLEQEHADNCTRFFEDVARQQTLCLVTSYTLHSIETILSNLKRFPTLMMHYNIMSRKNSMQQLSAMIGISKKY